MFRSQAKRAAERARRSNESDKRWANALDVKLAFRCTRMFRTKGSRYACSRPRSMPKDVDGCSDANLSGNPAVRRQLECWHPNCDPAILPRGENHLLACRALVSRPGMIGRHARLLHNV